MMILDATTTRLNDQIKRIPNTFIGGGALTSILSGSKINDYDMYPKDAKGYENLIKFGSKHGRLEFISENAVTFSLNMLDEDGERILFQVIRKEHCSTSVS